MFYTDKKIVFRNDSYTHTTKRPRMTEKQLTNKLPATQDAWSESFHKSHLDSKEKAYASIKM